MLQIDGRTLTLEDVARVARGDEREVELTPRARRAIDDSRKVVEESLSSGEAIFSTFDVKMTLQNFNWVTFANF